MRTIQASIQVHRATGVFEKHAADSPDECSLSDRCAMSHLEFDARSTSSGVAFEPVCHAIRVE